MDHKRSGRNAGKYYLQIQTRFGHQYYKESGVVNIGCENEEPFLYWTRHINQAYGFKTLKAARRMCEKLNAEHGAGCGVVNRDGSAAE